MYQSNRRFNIPPPGNPPGIWIFGNLCSNSPLPGPKSRSNAPLQARFKGYTFIQIMSKYVKFHLSYLLFRLNLLYPELNMLFWYHFFKIISLKHSMKLKYPRTFVRDRKDTIKSTWDTFEADVQIPHPLGGRIKFPTPGKTKASNARGMPGGGCWSFDLNGT